MYLLDADVFMTSANNYYAFDLAPGFWEWLKSPAVQASVASVEAVKEEVNVGNDDLAEWIAGLPEEFWLPIPKSPLRLWLA